LYLLESISATAPCVALPPASMQSTNKAGVCGNMVGLMPGRAVMQNRLQGLGYQSAPMPGGVLRSHTFHHSTIETSLVPIGHGESLYNTSPGEAIFRINKLTASYLHCYFASNPAAAAQLFLN
jgi:cobyrinic acid a,c-diamide synthase